MKPMQQMQVMQVMQVMPQTAAMQPMHQPPNLNVRQTQIAQMAPKDVTMGSASPNAKALSVMRTSAKSATQRPERAWAAVIPAKPTTTARAVKSVKRACASSAG
jgi:hypothetical protein